MLRDMLEQALAKEPEVELVSEPLRPVQERPAAPDLVIVGTETPEAGETPAALMRWPGSRVLLIGTHGHRVSLVELRPHRTELGEMSLAELVRLVTGVAHRPPA